MAKASKPDSQPESEGGAAATADKKSRSSRMSAQQRYQKNQRDKKILKTVVLGGLAFVLALVGLGVWRWAEDRSLNRAPDNVVAYDNISGDHTPDPVPYEVVPPAGGPHDPVWQNCGYYAQPIRSENAVHSLEHGAVWITYDPALPADQIETLKKLAEEQDYLIVSPFPGLPAPVVASSWNHQLQLESANDDGLRQFVRVYKQGPDTPEPGAACSGGTDALAPAS